MMSNREPTQPGRTGSVRAASGQWRVRTLIGGGAGVCGAILAAAGLASGSDRSARPPNEPGVCWRADIRPARKPTFTVLAEDAPNIASCAADVELAYLSERRAVTGAYQGYYIFSAPAAVTGAQRLGYIHYPIFNDAERALIDRRLREILRRGAPGAGSPRRTPTVIE